MSTTAKVYRAVNAGGSTYKYMRLEATSAYLDVKHYESWNATTHVGTNLAAGVTTYCQMTLLASFDASVTYKVTNLLDSWAKTRRYDNIGSLADYRDSPIEKFRNEGLRGQLIRDTTWFQLTNYLGGILTGVIPIPMSWAEIEAVLPPINWGLYRDWETDRKSTRLNSSHSAKSRMPSSA